MKFGHPSRRDLLKAVLISAGSRAVLGAQAPKPLVVGRPSRRILTYFGTLDKLTSAGGKGILAPSAVTGFGSSKGSLPVT